MHKDLEAMSRLVDSMQARIDWLENELIQTRIALARSQDVTEEVAIGQKMRCGGCNEWKPCMCDK